MSPISFPRRSFPLCCSYACARIAIVLPLALEAFAGGSKSTSSAGRPVHVRQYTRKDGTVVAAHDRAAPGTAAPGPRVAQSSAAPKATSSPLPKAAPPDAPRMPPGGATASAGAAPASAAKASTAPTPPVRGANGRVERSAAAKSAFQRSHPCPSTGASGGSCPGYVVDHVKPLACGGVDVPTNMQWQTDAAAKEKDKTKRVGCPSR
jgi:hypothetical protein